MREPAPHSGEGRSARKCGGARSGAGLVCVRNRRGLCKRSRSDLEKRTPLWVRGYLECGLAHRRGQKGSSITNPLRPLSGGRVDCQLPAAIPLEGWGRGCLSVCAGVCVCVCVCIPTGEGHRKKGVTSEGPVTSDWSLGDKHPEYGPPCLVGLLVRGAFVVDLGSAACPLISRSQTMSSEA